LSKLRSVGSTGSPLAPEGFEWVYEHVGADTWLFSTSGGTDVCSAFVGGVPLLPVYRGELQARALGAKVEAFDEEGNSVVDEVGELVLTAPLPSMPLYLWNDPDGERYKDSYFSMYEGIWRHGDWIEITSRGTAIISGRSDSTINRGGVRMGTSEIYRAVLAIDDIVDALIVDVPREARRTGCRSSSCCARARRSTTRSWGRSASGSGRTARLATCPPTSTPSRRCRAPSRASSSRSRSSGSSAGRRPRRRRARTPGQSPGP
jgi:acyl-CoA synthetase (AMP-forming)/AMP-acid ligase II